MNNSFQITKAPLNFVQDRLDPPPPPTTTAPSRSESINDSFNLFLKYSPVEEKIPQPDIKLKYFNYI